MKYTLLLDAINFAILAHSTKAKNPAKAWRKSSDGETPFVVHPLWCAMTILQEEKLDREIREKCAIALLFHDILEDTDEVLPEYISQDIKNLILELTFYGGTQEEMQKIWEKSDEAILCKLYDKTSNLLDSSFMNEEKLLAYKEYTLKLCILIEAKWGNLNIVKIAKALIS